MSDDAPEIDWDGIRQVSLSLAEILWSYHQALLATGFPDDIALTLTVAYQESWLASARA